jgi:hypothetical protein
LITRKISGEVYRSLSSSLGSSLHSRYLFPLRHNIHLSTLSNTISPRSSLNVSDKVSLPYKTTGKLILLYILIFIVCIVNWKTKDSATNDSKHSLASIFS